MARKPDDDKADEVRASDLPTATHALLVPGWGVAPGFRGMGAGGATLQLLQDQPEPLGNFLSLSAAHELHRAGRITWCDESGGAALPPPGQAPPLPEKRVPVEEAAGEGVAVRLSVETAPDDDDPLPAHRG